MSIYLNTSDSLIKYKRLVNSEYFVDKSMIIKELNKRIDTENNYICITRPRRFGKSSIINMLGAYYETCVDSRELFNKLKVSEIDSYEDNLNKHNVINLNFSDINSSCTTYEDYINKFRNSLKDDIIEKYPDIKIRDQYDIWDMLRETEGKFIFIIDEWDYIFNRDIFKENQEDFLEFLRNLLKDKPYVSLVYMTGILPIKKYSTGSALNMFQEYTFLKDRIFEEYFGFTEEEVKILCDKNTNIEYKELEKWYNGYMTATGIKIYNPRSVNIALTNNYCESYWTNTGAMDEVLKYLKYNILEVREDIVKMIDGEEVRINIREEFRAGQENPRTKVEIYSAMIVLGFLSYYNNRLRIPNRELMFEFEKAISNESFGEVAEIIQKSERMLQDTVNEESEVVSRILHEIHNIV